MTESISCESSLKRLLTDVIGSGPKSADDMTREQAETAFRDILHRSPDPTTLGAFFLANRWKRNTPGELAGYVDVMIEESVQSARPSASVLDCGANYDGKERTAILGVAAGLVAVTAGLPVAVHSGDRVPTKEGATYRNVLEELDIDTDLSPAESAKMVDAVGFGYYHQARFNPGVHALLDRRQRMGVRTFLNTIETLANPADADWHLGSFYHLAFAKKLIETIDRSEQLDFDRVLLVQGLEGYDDIRPGYTKLAEWDGTEIDADEIETANFGVTFDEDDLVVDDVARDSAQITREVISGNRDDHFADAVALNAGVRLFAGGAVTDVRDGYERAHQILADGEAESSLTALREFRPSNPRRAQ